MQNNGLVKQPAIIFLIQHIVIHLWKLCPIGYDKEGLEVSQCV